MIEIIGGCLCDQVRYSANANIAYNCCRSSPKGPTLISIKSIVKIAVETMREWRQRYRSRRELAMYSYQERCDLSFFADVDVEISKPFWRQ